MFDRFTERAKRTMGLSKDACLELQHDCIGPEHLLLGLLQIEDGVAAHVLLQLEIDRAATRRAVEKAMPNGSTQARREQIPFTPQAKRVLEFCMEEAVQMGNDHLGTEHILLGLLRDNGTISAQVLAQQGLSLGTARSEVTRIHCRNGIANEEGYRHVLKAHPHDIDAWCNFGALLEQENRLEEAEAAYRQALLADPASASAWDSLGHLLQRMGREEESTDAWNRVPAHEQGTYGADSTLASNGNRGEQAAADSGLEPPLSSQTKPPHATPGRAAVGAPPWVGEALLFADGIAATGGSAARYLLDAIERNGPEKSILVVLARHLTTGMLLASRNNSLHHAADLLERGRRAGLPVTRWGDDDANKMALRSLIDTVRRRHRGPEVAIVSAGLADLEAAARTPTATPTLLEARPPSAKDWAGRIGCSILGCALIAGASAWLGWDPVGLRKLAAVDLCALGLGALLALHGFHQGLRWQLANLAVVALSLASVLSLSEPLARVLDDVAGSPEKGDAGRRAFAASIVLASSIVLLHLLRLLASFPASAGLGASPSTRLFAGSLGLVVTAIWTTIVVTICSIARTDWLHGSASLEASKWLLTSIEHLLPIDAQSLLNPLLHDK